MIDSTMSSDFRIVIQSLIQNSIESKTFNHTENIACWPLKVKIFFYSKGAFTLTVSINAAMSLGTSL